MLDVVWLSDRWQTSQAPAAESDFMLLPFQGAPMPTNDNDLPTRDAVFASTDPYGRAALLLVESLIHGLCEHSILSADQAVEITKRAVDVQSDQAEAADGAGAPLWRSHALLLAIMESLRTDGGDAPTPPRLVT